MSTIAPMRDSSVSGRRIPLISTPTSSSRPSLDLPRSREGSPFLSHASNFSSSTNPHSSPTPGGAQPPKRNRAALREYYNLQAQRTTAGSSSLSIASQAPSSPSSSSIHSLANDGEELGGGAGGLPSDLDREGFDAEAYVRRVLEEKSLPEVLAIYRGVLSDVRSLEGERKALVYDNYSKLIVATETIGRLREGVGDRSASASASGVGLGIGIGAGARRASLVVDGMGVESVGALVERVRKGVEALRREGEEVERREREEVVRRARTRKVVERVLAAPERVRALAREGKMEEARRLWTREKALLERWRERGVGGDDVGLCIEEGDAALRGEGEGEGEGEAEGDAEGEGEAEGETKS